MGWEWRCFFVPRDGAVNALACAGKPEERTDLYLPVSAACGVKARGGSSEDTLEVKIRDGVADDGFERWSKEGVKASELARTLELGDRSANVLDWILELRDQLSIPTHLRAPAGDSIDSVWVSEQALRDPSAATNPIPFTAQDYESLLKSAIG